MAETNITIDTVIAQAIAAGMPQSYLSPRSILAFRNMLPWLLELQEATGSWFTLSPYTPTFAQYPRMLKRTVGGVLQTLIVTDVAADTAAQAAGWST